MASDPGLKAGNSMMKLAEKLLRSRRRRGLATMPATLLAAVEQKRNIVFLLLDNVGWGLLAYTAERYPLRRSTRWPARASASTTINRTSRPSARRRARLS